MESNSADKISGGNEAEGSKTTIEIKIKTLDSETYTLQVNKQMPVPELKEQIASVTGVLSEQQRLICRGRVLKDDQLLSAYHIEDGHTLHLVVRQPVPTSSGSLPSHQAPDTAFSSRHGQHIQVAPNVVVETFNIHEQGHGVPPDISRIVSALLGSLGINNAGSGIDGVDLQARDSGDHERMMGASSVTASARLQPDQPDLRSQSDGSHVGFGLPTSISGYPLQPYVIPDSLTTLSQYLSQLRQEYGTSEGSSAHAAAMQGIRGRESLSSSSLPLQERLPTPELLAEVLHSTREMIIEQTAECLLQLGRQLHNQSNVTDPLVRDSTQSNAWRSGIIFQNLGAFLLELGRTTMTLRMGQTPSEAMVNAGPAVFISESGPNPLMVQPLPFQPGTSFGVIPARTGQSGSGLFNDAGAVFVPRRIDIQIRRARASVNQEERAGSQQPSGQRNPAMSSGDETQVNQETSVVSEGPVLSFSAPIRTMVPASLSHLQNLSSGFQNEPQPVFESAVLHHARDGTSTNAAAEQAGLSSPHISHRFSVSVLSAGGTENHQPSEGEFPTEALQFLRALFPSSEIDVEDVGLRATGTGPVTDNAQTNSTAPDEPTVSDEGLFLSNLLGQIMPFIQLTDAAPDESSAETENSDVGTSRRRSDAQSSPPNSKRQKME